MDNIYPNPVDDVVQISGNSGVESELLLTNLHGQVLVSTRFENSAQINVGDLPGGVYFIKITSKNESHVEKIIIAH